MKKWLFIFSAALAMALSYQFNLYLVPFFVLVGFFVILDQAKDKFPKAMIIPLLLFVLIHSRWLLSLTKWEGLLSGFLVFMLASLLGLVWMLILTYIFWRIRSLQFSAIYRGLAVIIIEKLMLLGTFGYPLYSIYYTQAYSPFLGVAKLPILGASWISFFIVIIASLGAEIMQGKGNRIHKLLIIFFILWFMVACSGNFWRSSQTAPRQVDMIVLQPNIKEEDKLNASQHDQQLQYYAELVKGIQKTEPNFDVLFLPESIIGGLREEDVTLAFRRLGLSPQQILVFGLPIEREGNVYNSICFFQNGKIEKQYFKHKLVPYSETIPPLFNFLSKENVHYFSAGPPPSPITLNGVSYGPSICYESFFSQIYRSLKQVDVLVVLTNDAWFGSYFQELHLNSAIFRAAEMKKPLILANNTGISAFITAKGRVRYRIGHQTLDYFRVTLNI